MLIPIPAFDDNYIWMIHDGQQALVVDPGDEDPVMQVLQKSGLQLVSILVTHHHLDHVGGIEALREATGAQVYGPAGETMPEPLHRLAAQDYVQVLGLDFQVIEVPGHTAGHIAYHGHGAVFCGDTLFSGGCGRLFEGTPEQMLESLDRLAALPGDTRVYCAHEYTLANLRFALEVDPDNDALRAWRDEAAALRERGAATLPSSIGRERDVNPFLRSRTDAVRRAAERRAGATLGSPAAVFAEIRRWKDGFR